MPVPRHAAFPSPAPVHPEPHGHDGGLAQDLAVLLGRLPSRRHALGWLAGAGLGLAGCGGGGGDEGDATPSTPATTPTATTPTVTTPTATTPTVTPPTTPTVTTPTTPTTPAASCSVVPEETAGPFPGDGSNTSGGAVANALALSGIVRRDLRSSIAGATGVAAGVPLTLQLRLVSTLSRCADLEGLAVYLWHCDREGRYSMYSTGLIGENYLRGVQASAADGVVSFTTIFPGCYDGRMPHMHFEVFRSLASATSFSAKVKTSQIAFPTEVCQTVYSQASGYATSLTNLGRISFASDNVFSDGVDSQLAAVTGSVAGGYVATLTVGLAL